MNESSARGRISDPPYKIGSRFTVHWHVPLKVGLGSERNSSNSIVSQPKVHSSESQNKPLEGDTSPHHALAENVDSILSLPEPYIVCPSSLDDQYTLHLRVEKLIRIGRRYRAQVLTASICGSSGDLQYLQCGLPLNRKDPDTSSETEDDPRAYRL